jgi:cell fate (sporulation/competence/biofilm development) regulator YmcA (YheA/YmcA/DUF963 family)
MADADIGGLHMKLTADIAQLEAELARAKALSAETAASMSASAAQATSAFRGTAAAAASANAASRSFGIGGSGGGGFGSRGGVGRASPLPQQFRDAVPDVKSFARVVGESVRQLRGVSQALGSVLGLLARASGVIGLVVGAVLGLGAAIRAIGKEFQTVESSFKEFKETLDLSKPQEAAKAYYTRLDALAKRSDELQEQIYKSSSLRIVGNIENQIRLNNVLAERNKLEKEFRDSGVRDQLAQQEKVKAAERRVQALQRELEVLKQIQEAQRGRFTLYDVVFAVNANTEILKDIASRIR